MMKKQRELLKEQCIEMYEDDLQIAKEWEGTLMDGLDKNEKWWKLRAGSLLLMYCLINNEIMKQVDKAIKVSLGLD